MADPVAADLERSVSRVVVAQTARSLGFSACRSGALDVLVGVLQHYLKEACHLAHEAAEQAGRAQPCLTDVLRALRSLGCDVARLAGYVSACFDGTAAEVPFAQPLPRYPLRKRPRAVAPSFREAGEAPPGVQYPVWAPALPDPHTYRATPAHAPAKPDDARVRRELTQQTVSAEAALARLADALAPSAPTDYAVAAPERWGGDLRHPGAQRRREAEQRAASAEVGSGAAQNPYLRAGGAGAAARAQTGPKHAAVAVLAALPPLHASLPAPEAGADAGWVAQADTPAAEAVRGLLSVDAFSLHAGARGRAAARGVLGSALLEQSADERCFQALPGRDGSYRGMGNADAAEKARGDAERTRRILARDPHDSEILEDVDDLLEG